MTRSFAPLAAPLALVFACTALACGDAEGTGGGGGEGGGASGGGGGGGGSGGAGGGAAGSGGSAGSAGDRDELCAAGDAWIVTVAGTVVDEAGAPLENARAGFCVEYGLEGQDRKSQCQLSEPTDATGAYAITTQESARCVRRAAMRFFQFPSTKSSTYCMADLPTDSSHLDNPPFVLHETQPPQTLPPLGDDHLVRTVVFADGLELDIVPYDYLGEYAALGSTVLEPDHVGLCFIDDPSSLIRVYGFRPEGAFIDNAFDVRIPNTGPDALAPGTEVALYVLGGLGYELADGTKVPEGEWRQFGTATVSGDGSTISGDPLPFLNWFGFGPL